MTSTTWGRTWSVARLAMALATAAAVVAQLAKSLQSAGELGRNVTTVAVNFFSFFTILSNTLTAIVLVVAALWFLTRRQRDGVNPAWLEIALTAVSTYMIVTGIVYNTLLRNVELPQGSEAIGWSNEILHLIGPIFMLLDLFLGPARRRIAWSALGTIVLFPVAWVVYTLIRGPLVQNPATGAPFWYPYPFLDPNGAGGWPSVLVYIVGIAIVILAVGAFAVAVIRRRTRPSEARG